ncbi:hypothetical protein Raf01_08230 [Rugosimonospora africana]|uniref:Uncharacterized protein n=1 Tax=Rugosimonospora africana TaxID=556532 RepID=A0A8J3QP82_9ACTN|nr:hypothetical protein Raf01_08230 [Rugosimonospora africana]
MHRFVDPLTQSLKLAGGGVDVDLGALPCHAGDASGTADERGRSGLVVEATFRGTEPLIMKASRAVGSLPTGRVGECRRRTPAWTARR